MNLAFVRRKWGELLSLALAVGGIALSIYLYEAGKRERLPVLSIATPVEIFSPSQLASLPIQITRMDGSLIDRSIYAASFVFWNDGKEPIRNSDVLEPLTVSLSDSTSEWLDCKLVQVSREITGLRMVPISKREFGIDWRILEHEDGARGQIVYMGTAHTHLSVSGTIEGVRVISGKRHVTGTATAIGFVKLLAQILLVLVALIGGLYVLAFSNLLLSKVGRAAQRRWNVGPVLQKVSIVFTWAFMLAFAFVMLWGIIDTARDRQETAVPTTLTERTLNSVAK